MSADEQFLAQMTDLLSTPGLGSDERAAVLDLTRVIAHSTERRFGPLTLYGLGLSMGAAMAPDERTQRLRQAIVTLESLQDNAV